MVAANGVIVAPLVEMSWFHCLGQRLDNFPTVATAPQYPASPKLMQNVALAAALGLMAGVFATLRFSSRQSQKTLDE